MSVFKTTVFNIGSEAEMFKEEKMMILFGENAPESLADYCYNITLQPLSGDITSGMMLKIDNTEYLITSVGSVVVKNLTELGHITIKFDGSETPELPGTLYVEEKEMPVVSVGTTVSIINQ